jgi:predicted transcriptional regulator
MIKKKSTWIVPAGKEPAKVFNELKAYCLLMYKNNHIRLVDFIRKNPGLTVTELTERLGEKSNVVSVWIMPLAKIGILYYERNKKEHLYYVDEKAIRDYCLRRDQIVKVVKNMNEG